MIPRDLQDNFYHPTEVLDVKTDFAVEIVKERNFLHVVDLSFDARVANYF